MNPKLIFKRFFFGFQKSHIYLKNYCLLIISSFYEILIIPAKLKFIKKSIFFYEISKKYCFFCSNIRKIHLNFITLRNNMKNENFCWKKNYDKYVFNSLMKKVPSSVPTTVYIIIII